MGQPQRPTIVALPSLLSSSSPEQTRAQGAALARVLLARASVELAAGAGLPPACVVLLAGDYGCGKTTFVQGLASALGVRGAVRSPSYLIVKLYEDGALRLIHADFYRSPGGADLEELGLDELLSGGGGVLAVEWPAEALPVDPALPLLRLDFEARDESQRTITLSCNTPAEALLADWLAELTEVAV